MLHWRSFSRSGRLTSGGLCLLILCVVPYLLDVAICEESSASPLHQPVLLDGEEVDSSEDTAAFLSHDEQATNLILLSDHATNQWSVIDSVPLTPPNNFAVVSLTSRPPPSS
jgi:hypothetical protein